MKGELAGVMRGNLSPDLDPALNFFHGQTADPSVSVFADPVLNILNQAQTAVPGEIRHGGKLLICASMHPVVHRPPFST